jgi:hypothetical protein
VVKFRDTLAVAMPRGSGKTTLCLVAVMWALVSGRHPFVYLIASTQELALSMLTNIKSHLTGNDLLLADYPEAIYPIRCLAGESRRSTGQRYYGIPTRIGWDVDEVILPTIPGSRCSGSIIRVAGIVGNIRGALHVRPDGTQVRPSLVVCDDPQTDQSAKSMIQTAERLSIVNGAISGLAGPGLRTAIIIPCTVIHAGDMADQLLNRQKNPAWHGERTKLVYSFPTNARLWGEYSRIRDEALRSDGDGSEAAKFYLEHQAEMDEGAVAAWPQRYLRDRGEISAIQHAMNLRTDRGEAAFFAEYQNEPIIPGGAGELLTVEQVCNKANGRKFGEVPLSCTKLTMFVDIHNDLLFYCLCGWQEDFTGFVVEYGTFPQQTRGFFTLATATKTLAHAFPGAGIDGAIQAGLDTLVSAYLGRSFQRGDGLMRIDRLLVDMGYKPGVVAAVKHKSGGSTMMLCKGLGLRAGNRPMSTYKHRPGETHGHHWYIPAVGKTSEFPHVASDVNYWKSFVQERLSMAAGDPGSMTIFGQSREHELFAEHIANSETWVETQGFGRTVHEWTPRPSKPDNHWLDCLVGCAVAASMAGVKLPGAPAPAGRRKRYTQADLRRR